MASTILGFLDLNTLTTAAAVVGWVFFGCLVLVGGIKFIDLLTPGKLEHQVFAEKNVAAAVVYSGALLAIAVIIASAMH
ncbi:MAG: DUF350 domain-containing protein [Opitutus sp.]